MHIDFSECGRMKADTKVEVLGIFRMRLRQFRESLANLYPFPEELSDDVSQLMKCCDRISREIIDCPTFSAGIAITDQSKLEILDFSAQLCRRIPSPSKDDFLQTLSELECVLGEEGLYHESHDCFQLKSELSIIDEGPLSK
jgi:hypothetical protein